MNVRYHTSLIELYDMTMQPALEAALKVHSKFTVTNRKISSEYNDFEVYYYLFRSQILNFLTSENKHNYVAALLLTIPIIDRASQIGLSKAEPSTNECLDWLNSIHPNEDEDRIQTENVNDSLRKLFVNGLKHDAFIRQGISIKTHFEQGMEQVFPVQIYTDSGEINVHPILWCRYVIYRLDFFYIEFALILLYAARKQGRPRSKEIADDLIAILQLSLEMTKKMFT